MTLDEIVDFAGTLFDEPSSGKYMSDGGALARQLGNLGYVEICRESRCSFQTNQSSLTLASYGPYALPSGALVLIRLDIGAVAGTPNTKLQRIRMNDINPARTGKPNSYNITGGQLFFYPNPDAAYPYKTSYAQGPAADIAGGAAPSLIPAAWHYVLAYYIVFQYMKIDKGDAGGGAAKWQAIYENELNKMKHYLEDGISADYYIGSNIPV